MAKMKSVTDILESLPEEVKKSIDTKPTSHRLEEGNTFPPNLSILNVNSHSLIPSKPQYIAGAMPGDLVYSPSRVATKSVRILPLLIYEQVVEYGAQANGARDSQAYKMTRFDMDVYKKYPEKNKASKTVLPNGNVLDRQMKLHARIILDENGTFEEGYPPVVLTMRGPEIMKKDSGVSFLRNYMADTPIDNLYVNSLLVTSSLEAVFDQAMSKFFVFQKDQNLTDFPDYLELREHLRRAYVECVEKLAKAKDRAQETIQQRGF